MTVNARVPDQVQLEAAIAALVAAFEASHDVHVSSIWVEHTIPPAVEVTVMTRKPVRVT